MQIGKIGSGDSPGCEPVRPASPLAAYKRAEQRLTAPGADFALAEVAVDGRKTRVFAGADPSAVDCLLRAERLFPDRILLCEDGRTFTYAEIFAASRRLAAALQARAIGAGDRIGILMRNRAEWFIAFAATLRVGAVAVLFNSREKPSELEAAVRRLRCSLIIADDERAALLRDGAAASTLFGPADLRAACAPGGREIESTAVAPDAPAAILFTSGTAGSSGAAILTQRNLVNMERNVAFIGAATVEMEAELLGMTAEQLKAMLPRPVGLLVFPLFHVSGLTAFFRTIAAGGEIVLLRRWDPEAALAVVAERKVTMLSGPPLMLSDLLACERIGERLASVSALVVGGQAMLPGLVERASAALPKAAWSIGWGMTEVSGAVTAANGSLFCERPDSAGIKLPLTDIRVVDDLGHDLPAGEAGELLVAGALVMQGYDRADGETADILCDGWLRTGDLGWVDEDGFVFLLDRKKDIVIVGGENVYCGEVERVLGAHPDVTEALVFGMPDARLGERLVAVVTLRPGARCAQHDLLEASAAALAPYKIPSSILINPLDLPRNATGKVNKRQLRARLMSASDAAAERGEG